MNPFYKRMASSQPEDVRNPFSAALSVVEGTTGFQGLPTPPLSDSSLSANMNPFYIRMTSSQPGDRLDPFLKGFSIGGVNSNECEGGESQGHNILGQKHDGTNFGKLDLQNDYGTTNHGEGSRTYNGSYVYRDRHSSIQNDDRSSNAVVHVHIHESSGDSLFSRSPRTSSGVPTSSSAPTTSSAPQEAGLTSASKREQTRSEQYTSLFLGFGIGYPLWKPSPRHTLDSETEYIISIGDVGTITDGLPFNTLFNITQPLDSLANNGDVPEGVHPPCNLDSRSVTVDTVFHRERTTLIRPKNSAPCTAVKTLNDSSEYSFTLTGSHGALLSLPQGSVLKNLESRAGFKERIEKHWREWYKFAEKHGDVGERQTLYVVTGVEQCSTWAIAAWDDAPANDVNSAVLKLVVDSDGRCSWNHFTPRCEAQSMADFVSEKDRSTPKNTVFIRGFWLNKFDDKMSYSYLPPPNEARGSGTDLDRNNRFRGNEGSGNGPSASFSFKPASASGFGSTSSHGGGHSEDLVPYEVFDSQGSLDSAVESPCEFINQFAFAVVSRFKPGALDTGLIALSHDDDWISIIRKEDDGFLTKRDFIRRICWKSKFVVENGIIFVAQLLDNHVVEPRTVRRKLIVTLMLTPGTSVPVTLEFIEPEPEQTSSNLSIVKNQAIVHVPHKFLDAYTAGPPSPLIAELDSALGILDETIERPSTPTHEREPNSTQGPQQQPHKSQPHVSVSASTSVSSEPRTIAAISVHYPAQVHRPPHSHRSTVANFLSNEATTNLANPFIGASPGTYYPQYQRSMISSAQKVIQTTSPVGEDFIKGKQYNIWHGSENRNLGPPEEKWKVELYREYERIPAGRIKTLKSTVIETQKVTQTASLVGEEEIRPFRRVSYVGKDAQKVFKRDFIQFPRIRHANFAQLRGTNDSDIPMTLFQDYLIPVAHVLQHHSHSLPALFCYFSLQASTALKSLAGWNRTLLSDYECESVWIQPGNGMVMIVPNGPPTEWFSMWSSCVSPIQGLNLPTLPLDLCNSNNILHHLVQYASSRFVLETMEASSRPRFYYHPLDDFPANTYLWVNTSGQRRPVGRFQGGWVCNVPFSPVFSKPTVMEDGRSRFLVNNIPDWNRDFLCFAFHLNPERGEFEQPHLAWLAQACSFFARLNIPKEQWSSYEAMSGRVYLNLRPQALHEPQCTLDLPCYLFAFPPPQLLDGSPDIPTWIRGENLYYWSSDPDGRLVMPEGQRLQLGLPLFTPDHEHFRKLAIWGSEVYDFIWSWQTMNGFDPTTIDFARSLGYPVLESIAPTSEEARFEVLSLDTDLSTGTRIEGMDVDSVELSINVSVESIQK